MAEEDQKNNPGQADYDQRFGGLAKAEEEGTVSDKPEVDSDADLTSQAADQENAGSWQNNTSASSSNPSGQVGFLVSAKRKKGPLIGILLTLLVGGGGVGFFLGPALAPIAFFENITDDLNDQLAAMDIREGYVFRSKLPSADRNAALAGCTKLSIRCRFATISATQEARLKAAGIEVQYERATGLFNKRIKPEGYKFQGVTYSPEGWAEQLKTNPLAQHAQRRANNMKYLGVSDNVFSRVMKRFGISKKPPELKGSAKDRVNALMNSANENDPKNLKMVPALDADGVEIPGEFMLEGDESGKTYTEAEKNSIEKSVNRVVNAKPPSRVTKATLGALSVLGYWDLACSIKNMLVGASVAAKIANQAQLIQYVMPLASLASKIKAGDATAEEAEALGTFFTQTDSRQYLPNIEASVSSTSVDNGIGLASDVPNTLSNPDFGKSAMDSELYKMSAMGGIAPASTTRSQYSLGYGQNSLLAGISGFADIASMLVNLGDASMCKWVQNPLVRIAGTVVGVVTAVGSGGASAAAQIAIAAGMMAAMLILDNVINNALNGGNLVNPETLSEAPIDRADAAWTGMSGLLGSAAQGRGMIPGNAEQVTEYAMLQNKTEQSYIAMESETANPLDINNKYSFLGSFSRSLLGYSAQSFSPVSFLKNVSSIVSGGLSTVTKPYSAYAAVIDQSRFKQCDDTAYQAMGINADVQCNVRYIMPTADLSLDTDEVARWMEEQGFVEKDTESGLPLGYSPIAPKQSQGAALDFLTGTVQSAIDTTVNTRDFGEYGKFLDYCVFRTLPFGETGEETSEFNGAGDEWKTGKKCMEEGGQISYFRIYTLDKSVQAAADGTTDIIADTTDGSDYSYYAYYDDSVGVEYVDETVATTDSTKTTVSQSPSVDLSVKDTIVYISDDNSGYVSSRQNNIIKRSSLGEILYA